MSISKEAIPTLHNLERADIVVSLEIELETLKNDLPIIAREGTDQEKKAAFARQAEVSDMLRALKGEEPALPDPTEDPVQRDLFKKLGRASREDRGTRETAVANLPTGCVLRTTFWGFDSKQMTENLVYLPGVYLSDDGRIKSLSGK